MADMSMQPSPQLGRGTQRCSSVAPAMASTGITTIQKYQYSQPTAKPAQSPSPARANSVKERTVGISTAISPRLRMTSRNISPVMA